MIGSLGQMIQWGMVALVLGGAWLWVGGSGGYVGTMPGQWGDGMGVVTKGGVNVFLLLFAIERSTQQSR